MGEVDTNGENRSAFDWKARARSAEASLSRLKPLIDAAAGFDANRRRSRLPIYYDDLVDLMNAARAYAKEGT